MSISPEDSGLDVGNDVVEDYAENDTDSYVTMSEESSLIINDNDTLENVRDESGTEDDHLYMDFYQNNNQTTSLENSGETVGNTILGDDVVLPRIIGHPGFNRNQRENILQKSARFFLNSKESKSFLVKSRSEGNIKELIDKDSKPSLFTSLYRGFSSMSFRCPEQKQDDTDYTSPANYPLSLGNEVSSLGEHQLTVQKLRNKETSPSVESDVRDGRHTSLFSCFSSNLGNKAIMPNHRNFMRPRDVKEYFVLTSFPENILILENFRSQFYSSV